MSNSLGVLTLDLVAKIRDFVEPLRQAERQTSTTSKSILKDFDVASLAVKTFGAIVAGVTITDLAGFVSRTIDAGNEIKKLALLSNASTSQFQYYAYGAKTAGFEIEDFADKMKDMQDRIGDFQQTGGGPLADFFTNIAPLVGVTIQQFQKLSGPEALQLFYDSLEKVGATENDIKFYMESIIGDSSKLLPLLENGGAGFKRFGDAAKASGAILSEDVVNDLDETKKSLQLLDLKWEGLKNRLASDITPAIKDAVDNFDTIQAVVVALASVLGVKLLFQVGALSVQFAVGVAQSAAYQASLMALQGQSLRTATAMGVLKAISGALGGPLGIGLLVAQGAAAYATFKYMKSGSQDLSSNLDAQSLSVQELIKKYNELTSAQKEAFSFEESKKLVEATKDYKNAKANFYDSAVGIAYEGANSDTAVAKVDTLVKSFKNGEITALSFADALSEMGIYSKEQISTAVKFAEVNDNAKLKLENQQKVVETLTGKANKLGETHKATTLAISDQTRAYQALTEKQRSYITQLNQDSLRENYIKDLVGRGFSQEKANTFADTQASVNEGFAFKKGLPKEVVEAALKDFNSKNYELSASDRKKIAGAVAYALKYNIEELGKAGGLPQNLLTGLLATESAGGKNLTSPTGAKGAWQTTEVFRKQHAKILKDGNYSEVAYAQAAIKDLKDNFMKFGNWADAIMAYNGGAGGVDAFKAGRVSDKVKTLSGSQKIDGQLYLSPAKYKEMQEHQARVLKYQAGASNSTKVDQSMMMPTSEDLLKWQNEAIQTSQAVQDAKDAFEKQLSTPLKQIELENNETVEKLQEAYADDPKKLKEMLDKNNVLYQANRNQLIADRKNEYDQYFSFEKDRVTQISESYDYEISKIKENTNFSLAERKDMAAAKERQKQSEIESVKREEQLQVQSAFEAYMNETEIVLSRYKVERDEITKNYQLSKETREKLIQANQMAVGEVLDKNRQKIDDRQYQSLDYVYRQQQPSQAAWTDLQNQYDGAQGSLSKDYSEQRGGIFDSVDDDLDRNAQLIAAHEDYLMAKAALDDEYAQREKDLIQSQQESQLSAWGNLLGQAQNTWGQITQSVKDANGDQSAAFKSAFLMQQTFALGSAYVATHLAAIQAMAAPDMVLFGQKIVASQAILAMGYANMALIGAQTIAGFSGGGYTGEGGKYDVAGVVHKGEVVWSQDDVNRWGGVTKVESMRLGLSGYSDGGVVGKNMNVSDRLLKQMDLSKSLSPKNSSNIIINNNASTKVAASQGSDGKIYITVDELPGLIAGQLRNPNSQISKSVQQNTTAVRRR